VAKHSKKIVWTEGPKVSLAQALYVPAILEGIKTTLSHLIAPRMTREYPEVEPTLPNNYRGAHRLNRDEKGRVKCVACYLCQTACPADCIAIEAAAAPQDDPAWADRDKYPASFVIDELRCIYCGMCEEACPVDAIELTSIYDLTGSSRAELMFDKEKLLQIYDQTKDSPNDPIRTHRGELGMASEIVERLDETATRPRGANAMGSKRPEPK
jgi:NADH-quinone oxidoreductase subunit I